MARKTEIREIGGNYFRATQMKVRKANRVLERLIKIFGESLGALADNLGSKDTSSASALVGDLQRGALSDAAGKIVGQLSGDQLNWLVEELRVTVEFQTPELRAVNDSKFVPMSGDVWDEAFAGELMDQFKVLGWILQLNYQSFFSGAEGLGNLFARFVTPTKSDSSSPTIQSPGSGDSPPASI